MITQKRAARWYCIKGNNTILGMPLGISLKHWIQWVFGTVIDIVFKTLVTSDLIKKICSKILYYA